MPMYFYECEVCHLLQRHILSVEEMRDGNVPCKSEGCGGKLRRSPRPPTTRITETLDNGAMARKLERLADAEQIFHERAKGKKGTI